MGESQGLSALERVKASARDTVTTGGVQWVVRRVNSMDVLQAGLATLLVLPQGAGEGDDRGSVFADLAAAQAAGDQSSVAALASKIPVDILEQLQQAQDAVVCAGVVALGDVGGPHEPVKLTIAQSEEDHTATPQVLWVGDLPQEARTALYHGVMGLSSARGEAWEGLASFR